MADRVVPRRSPAPPRTIGPGATWLVAIAILAVVNIVARRIDDPLRQIAFYLVAMGLPLAFERMRAALPKAQGIAILGAGLYVFAANRAPLAAGQVQPGELVTRSIRLATGLGAEGGIQVSALLRRLDAAAALGPYARYADKVDARSSEINILASHLASLCESNDHLCEAAAILRFVADDVQYRADPRGDADYIKTPQETLAANAGDCEDKSILLVSLLEALGNRTWLAFTDDHVWPLVCFDHTLPALFEGRAARRPAAWRARYMEALAPHHDQDELLRLLAAAREISLDGRYCYAMEPTAAGSFLGVDHGDPPRVVAIDPIGRKRVDLARAAPAPAAATTE